MPLPRRGWLQRSLAWMEPGFGEDGMRIAALTVLSFVISLGAPAAQAQYTAKEWPEGPSKARFVATCDGCHDINRVRVGYTPDGWLTASRMMQNMQAAVPPEEWGPML